MKSTSVLILVCILSHAAWGADGWTEVNEGFRFEIPADWKKKDVKGIDSHVGCYEGPSGRLEFDMEFGNYTAQGAREALAEMKAKEANPKLLKPGEEIWHINGHLAHFTVSPDSASLFIPDESNFWILSIHITFAKKDDLPTVRRILGSVKLK